VHELQVVEEDMPCVMEKDPAIGDTILHKAGYIIRAAVEEGMMEEIRISVLNRKIYKA